MKITSINNITFKGENIDMHWHEGTWKSENAKYTNKDTFELIGKPFDVNINGKASKEEIKHVLISNLDCMTFDDNKQLLKNEIDGNMDMLKECKKYPQKKAYAVCQVGWGNAENIEKIITENPDSFIGLKFHPMVFEKDANLSIYDDYMKIAEKYNLPCLFHSDKTNSFACPKKIHELAKRFPKVPVILAHMGIGTDHKDAINVLKDSITNNDSLIYVDTSWVDFGNKEMPAIKGLIEYLQNTSTGDYTHRILYGSDAPLGEFGAPGKKVTGFYADALGSLKSMIYRDFGDKADIISNNICKNNAQELFFDKNWIKDKGGQAICEAAQNISKSGGRASRFIIGGLIIISGIAGVLYGVTQKNKSEIKDAAPIIQQEQNSQYEAAKPQLKLLA